MGDHSCKFKACLGCIVSSRPALATNSVSNAYRKEDRKEGGKGEEREGRKKEEREGKKGERGEEENVIPDPDHAILAGDCAVPC